MTELLVDVDKIGANTEVVVRLMKNSGLRLVAVTKGCMGEPRVASAMVTGGAAAVAGSRDSHIRRLREARLGVDIHRIGLPSAAKDLEVGDVNYMTSWEHAESLIRAGGAAAGKPRRVMLQVETGDEREGVPTDQLRALARQVVEDRRLELVGVSTNYACLRGKPEGLGASVEAVAAATRDLVDSGIRISEVSGGNSSVLSLVARGDRLPGEVTSLRCGEALLLGHDALYYQRIEGCSEDSCKVRAEVVEEYTKRSAGYPTRRLVLALGRRDLNSGAVKFLEPGLTELGRSADYLVVEAGPTSGKIRVGMKVEMIPDYEALVSAWISPYVEVKLDES